MRSFHAYRNGLLGFMSQITYFNLRPDAVNRYVFTVYIVDFLVAQVKSKLLKLHKDSYLFVKAQQII